MALERHILLPQAQRQAGGNPQLLAHQIHTGDQLGDAVLYLDAGVHLHEIEMLPVRVQQELHCAGILIANGFGRLYGGGAHPLPQLRRQTPGRGLLDELLVPPLDRAVPVPQMDDVAVAVRQHLELDVPGPEHQFLQIHLVIAEAGLGLCLGLRKGRGQLLRPVAPADAPPAAAGGRLQQHRIAYGLCRGQRLLHRGDRAVGAGGHGHAGGAHQVPRGRFGAGLADGVAGGADEGQASCGAGVCKVGVFREEAIAGMDAVAPGGFGHRQKSILIQIAVCRPGRADAHRLSRQLDMERVRVRLGVYGHRLDPQLPAGPQDPQGDLSPVGDQYPPQHGR